MKNTQLKWFSFVEILMIITILAIISVIAYTSFWVKQNQAINTRIQSEVISLWNALLLAKQENKILPQPQWNRNFFAEDTSYVHDYEDNNTFWVHGFITHNTLAKKYIDIVPVDPRTWSFYAYWKTKWTGLWDEMYEIAWVIWDWDIPNSYVTWDYTAENGPFNLIREYNGPNFVHNDSTLHFPYNPIERVLTATIDSFTWSISINWNNSYSENEILNYVLKSWDTIEVPQNGVVELYYSDGSRSVLWDSSNKTKLTLQKMEFTEENNLITDIKLVLESWMIWNKAASLDEESGFEIYTTDSTAAVRWTIFWVQKNNNSGSEIVVKQWTVAVNKIDHSILELKIDNIKNIINNGDIIPTISMNTATVWITEKNWETVIIVTDNTEIWVGISIGGIEIPNSILSIDDIPEIISEQIIDENPIINENINISLEQYSYSSTTGEVNIQLEIPEKVYKTADFIVLNGKDIIYKSDWENLATLSWSLYTQIFNNSTWKPTDSMTEDELQVQSQAFNVIKSLGFDNFIPQTHASIDDFYTYITSQLTWTDWEFSIQLWKKSLNWKIRLTNKINFTIVDDKLYKKQEDNTTINAIEIQQEQLASKERWAESLCDWFKFTNIWGDEICADADDTLKLDDWQLRAYAPYDHAGDIYLYKPDSSSYDIATDYVANIDNKWNPYKQDDTVSNSRQNWDPLSLIWLLPIDTISHIIEKSFVELNNWTKWIFLTNDFLSDYLQYQDLNSIGNDFTIEMNVKWLDRTGKYYLLDWWSKFKFHLNSSWEFQLQSKNNFIGGDDTIKTSLSNIITDSDFHTLTIKVEYKKIYVYIDGSIVQFSWSDYSEIINNIDLNNLNILWSEFNNHQWNNIIDYIKIYNL